MRMLCWTCGVTKFGRTQLKNQDDNESGILSDKVQESRLKQHGHVMRREEHYAGTKAMGMEVQWRKYNGGSTMEEE